MADPKPQCQLLKYVLPPDSLSCPPRPACVGLKQIVKQIAIIDQRRPRILRAGLHDEDVLALVQAAGGRGGILFTTNQFGPPDQRHDPPPTVSIEAEQYNRVFRLTQTEIPLRMEIELETRFYPKPDHFNVLADIPGTSKKEELVVVGAHLDSWFGATGATDNARPERQW